MKPARPTLPGLARGRYNVQKAMCGRFTLTHDAQTLARTFRAEFAAPDYRPSYNIAPTQSSLVVIGRREHRVLRPMRWGLIPHWAQSPDIGHRMINARMETVAQLPAFRVPFRKRRCIVPASGFFEWRKTPRGKIPYYITAADGSVLPFAGLWDRWDQDRDTAVETFTILTTDATEELRPLHHRMPVLLDEATWPLWLDAGEEEARKLLQTLRPPAPGRLRSYPVSRRVNSPEENDPELLKPVRAPGIGGAGSDQPSLF